MKEVPLIFVEESIIGSDNIERDDKGRAYRYDLSPGSTTWYSSYNSENKHAGLIFICPCGCSTVHSIDVQPPKRQNTWTWNGDVEKPTVMPSIQCNTPCGWHGYLTNGVFVKQ